ncbi:hypothetical protein ACVRZR_02725 [Streptococcus entericus]|uniref:hypothetical protein n=1 Tax=Streptococcus entericus TaxID=155680 RepID=UPI00035F153F|nr:hypothetical protein [Streptococcus entericus]
MFKKIFQAFKAKTAQSPQATLVDDLPEAIEWTVDNLTASGYLADFSLSSIAALDDFFETEKQEGGVLRRPDGGIILFAVAAYLGETLIANYGGKWELSDEVTEDDLDMVLILDGKPFYPVRVCQQRLKSASPDGLQRAVTEFFQPVEHRPLQNDTNELE